MQDFKKLNVYIKAYELSKKLYKDIEKGLESRLKSQLFGAVTSIPANLAEMAAFDTNPQKIHKLRIAIGEANEAEFWLDFIRDTGQMSEDKANAYIEELIQIRKMLIALMKSIK